MEEDSANGTGIGLALVKNLTDLHHGTIKVESNVGAGSKFIIEIPYSEPSQTSDIQAEESWEDRSLSKNSLHIINEKELVTAEKQKEHTVLIAEDNKELRIYISQLTNPFIQCPYCRKWKNCIRHSSKRITRHYTVRHSYARNGRKRIL